MEEHSIVQCVGPQCKVHRCGPSSPGMQKLLSCAFGEVADGALGDTILKVGVHATEGELLVRIMTCLFEGVIGKLTIVTVIVVDSDTMFGSKGLKGAFGGDRFD